MRFKVVPEPRPLSFLGRARLAMPLVPGSEDDCCARLVADTDLASRDAAREWITFMQALGLVAETDGQYYQTGEAPEDVDLARAFRERVHPVEAVLTVLDGADDPLDAEAVFDRVVEEVPQWERSRRTDWTDVWRERVERVLEWAVTFGLAERVGGDEEAHYRPVEDV
ncbi:hypothetical protein [Halomarina litorea]|uniref:hypothetical protein n=1 Tax=Halomarina litorea TaxID=2961595 RepID=UPI0020C32035|nr:hypothetical protein [Halomarina sp. BCD28]